MADIKTQIDIETLRLHYLFEYGIDLKNRAITITGDIDSDTFRVVDLGMSEMELSGKGAITIKLNSTGGSIYDAMAVVGRLNSSRCPIITKGYGAIMSAATLILASGDKRIMSKYSSFMHHEASYGMEGRHSEVKAVVIQMDKDNKIWSDWMSEFTKMSPLFWSEKGLHVDCYLTPEECKKYGIVDKII